MFKHMESIRPPVCDAGIQAFGVLPVGPFNREPPGGSSNLITKGWSKLGKITKNPLKQ